MKNLCLRALAIAMGLFAASVVTATAIFPHPTHQDPCSLSAPASLNGTVTSPSSASLSWPSVSGAYGYRVRVQTVPAGETVGDFLSFNLSASLSGLTTGATYRCTVAAVCADNQDSPSPGSAIVIDIIINYAAPGGETLVDASPVPLPITVDCSPNPFGDFLHLRLPPSAESALDGRVRVFSLTGALVFDQHVSLVPGAEVRLETNTWSPGIYLLHLETAYGVSRQIMVKKG